MRSKLLGGAAAVALTACTVLATSAPASAAPWGWHRGWYGGGWGWGGAVAAGVIGGAVAAATSPLWGPGYDDGYPRYAYQPGYAPNDADGPAYAPTYAYGEGPAVYGPAAPASGTVVAQADGSGDAAAYCAAHFKSFDPASGTYLGYDGVRHSCPSPD